METIQRNIVEMDCGKDEAIRAKEMAEVKLLEKDIAGAQKFATEAQSLFPSLEGLSLFVKTLEIYASAEKRVNGEVDWYAILGVNHSADVETVRNSFLKLVLTLRPSENKSVGSEGAYKLICDAWSLLSDKAKRLAYDQKRNPEVTFQKTKTQSFSGKNGFNHHKALSSTFWTACNGCRMNYEYRRDYVSQKLLCPKCCQPFWAVEVPMPPRQHQTANHNSSGGSSANSSKFQFSRPGIRSRKEANCTKKKALVSGLDSMKNLREDRKCTGYRKGATNRAATVRNLSQSQLRNILMAKAKAEIKKRLKTCNLPQVPRKESREIKEEKPSAAKEKDGDTKKHFRPKVQTFPTADDASDPNSVSMTVPDPEFHNFDGERSVLSFRENQVWAAYDCDDGMPRYYASIHRVISKRPFKVQISWLNSKTNTELGPMNWVGSGFTKTSGDFYVGKHAISNNLSYFSHVVKWSKGKRGVIQLFPRKGDVWALYKNWSSDWNEFTSNELIHDYEMVEVIEDYNEEQGVVVRHLMKALGFRAVFYESHVAREEWKIPREELFRFSHQVPSYSLTGKEAWNLPKGSCELDPAAMPPGLLQVWSEEKNFENYKEKPKVFGNFENTMGKGLITYARKKSRKE